MDARTPITPRTPADSLPPPGHRLDWVMEDERFKGIARGGAALDNENREILREISLDRMQERTLDEWMEVYVKDGNVAAEPFIYTAEAMQHRRLCITAMWWRSTTTSWPYEDRGAASRPGRYPRGSGRSSANPGSTHLRGFG